MSRKAHPIIHTQKLQNKLTTKICESLHSSKASASRKQTNTRPILTENSHSISKPEKYNCSRLKYRSGTITKICIKQSTLNNKQYSLISIPSPRGQTIMASKLNYFILQILDFIYRDNSLAFIFCYHIRNIETKLVKLI